MSSFFSGTATLLQTSRLPAGTTQAQAIAMLHDLEFFLSCDPHLDKFELIPPSDFSTLNPHPSIPDYVKPLLEEEATTPLLPTCYRVTDIVHAVPAGLWDTSVVSTYEFAGLRDGVFVRVRSPLSVVMDTFWRIREVAGEGDGEGGGLELVEDMTIRCSRLLVGLVKGQCENGWGKIHAKMIERLEGEGGKGVAGLS